MTETDSSEKSFKAFVVYDAISKDYDAMFRTPSAHLDSFLQLLKNNSTILDAGCGNGADSAYMTSLGFSVTGVDLSEKMLALAKKKTNKAKFLRKDITMLDFEDSAFDAILASYSLIHVPKSKIKATLLNFRRMLKKDGILNLGLQEDTSKEISIPEPFNPNLMLDVNVFSLEEIRRHLNETGFVEIQYYLEPAKNEEELSFNKLCILARKAQ